MATYVFIWESNLRNMVGKESACKDYKKEEKFGYLMTSTFVEM